MTDEPSKQEFAAVAPLPTSPVKVPGQGAPSTIVLSPEEQQAVTRMFGNPNYFPEAFKSWIVQYMALNQEPVPRSQVQGLSQFAARSDFIATAQTTSSTSYTDLATVGPQITDLSDGTYLLIYGASIYGPTSGNDWSAGMSISVNGAAADDNDRAHIGSNISAASNAIEIGVSMAVTKTLSNNNNNTIVAKYKTSSGDNPSFSRRWLIALKVGN